MPVLEKMTCQVPFLRELWKMSSPRLKGNPRERKSQDQGDRIQIRAEVKGILLAKVERSARLTAAALERLGFWKRSISNNKLVCICPSAVTKGLTPGTCWGENINT